MVRMVRNSNFVVVNGKRVRTSTAPQVERAKRLQRQAQQKEREAQIRQEASRLDNILKNNNFGGSVKAFISQYNKIKQQNPEVAKALKFNPNSIKDEIKKRVTTLENIRKEAREQERKIRRRKNKTFRDTADARGKKAFQKGIDRVIDQVRRGEFISINEAKNFAKKAEKAAEKEAKLTGFNELRAKRTTIVATTSRKSLSGSKVRVKETKAVPVKKKSKGVLTKSKKPTIGQRISKAIAPSKRAQDESGVVRGAKGAARFGVDVVVGTSQAAKTLSQAFLGDKKAQQRIKQGIADFSLSAVGASIGRQVASKDPYQKTQGALSIASLAYGPRVGRGNVKVGSQTSTYRSQISAKTNSAKTVIDTKGRLVDGTAFTQKATLRYNPKSKTVTGNVVTRAAGDSKIEKINLKDKGGFYVDSKTGKKISKNNLVPNKIQYNIKEVKTKKIGTDIQRTLEGKAISTGQRIVKTKTVRGTIEKGKRKEVTKQKVSKIDFATDYKGRPIDVKSIRQKFDAKYQSKRTAKQRSIDDRAIKKFLESIRYDVALLDGLDKRTRLAKALGLQKTSPLLKKISEQVKKGVTITRKGSVTATGKVTRLYPIKFNFGIALNRKTKLTKTQQNLLKVPRTVSVPILKNRVKTLKGFRTRGVFAPKQLSDVIQKLENKIKQIEKSKIKTPKRDKATVTAKTQIRAQKKAPKTAAKQKVKTTTKTPTVRVKGPRVRGTIRAGRAFRVLSLSSKTKKGENISFDARYREKGKTKTLSLGLPRYKALKKIQSLIDNTTSRSMELVVKGITKTKDIKKFSSPKFTVRKKNSKALRIVEKAKFALDRKGEKKGLRIAKRLKRKK